VLSKKLAAVDKTRCVACGVCENTCPLGAVKVRRGCYAAVEAERCIGCGKCARLCPVGCIEVKARDEAWRKQNIGTTISGSAPSSTSPSDFSTSSLRGWAWSTSCCRWS